MKKPIGYIGPFKNTKIFIEKHVKNNDYIILEVDNKSSIDDIKEFRAWLLKEQIKRKIGVIHFLNRFNSSQEAVLLKVFEEKPDYVDILFTATCEVSNVIMSRSQIYRFSNFSDDEKIKTAMKKIMQAMKNSALSKEMIDAWYILLHTISMFQDEIISEKEKLTICESLGL